MTHGPREIAVGPAGLPEETDVLVVGLGITGAGVALDAASRGLDVVAIEAQDLAFGTSRWSSKLVHGGLRYLAKGQLGIAHESAVERRILMETTAPHLVRALPMLMPLTDRISAGQEQFIRAGLRAGDLLRVSARTATDTLPRSRRISPTETTSLAPGVRREKLRGALLSWDGQLEDDARLVVTVARTAVREGARLHTRTRLVGRDGTVAVVADSRTGTTRTIRARVIINATGVWAGEIDNRIWLRPSRGSHLVLRGDAIAGSRCAVMAPVPGESNRYVFALPQPDGAYYLGLTDEELEGPIPDLPAVPSADVDFLIAAINPSLAEPLSRSDVVGSYAGLRPLLRTPGRTADLSRKHAVLTTGGMVTVVGGKLTTYRRMAQDAVDAAVAACGLDAGPCRTASLPLLGAAPRTQLDQLTAPARLVRRYGTDADLVVESAREASGLGVDELLAPVSEAVAVTLAELIFAITHEGAATVADLLDRRTRVGLIPADATTVTAAAQRALALVAP